MAAARTQPPKTGKGWGGALCDLLVAAIIALGKGTWWTLKHPAASFAASVFTAGVFILSEQFLKLALGALIVSPAIWATAHHESFRQVGVAAVRDGWRRLTIYQTGWREALINCGLMKRYETEARVPKIVGVRGSEFFDSVTVKMLPGQTRKQFNEAAPALASSFGADLCRIHKVERKPRQRGTKIRIDFQRKDALREPVPPFPIPIEEPVNLEAIPVGRTEYGGTWFLGLIGTHILIGGATGAGKASVLWSIIRGMAPSIRDGLVELWGIDPKNGVELIHGKPMFTRYAGEGTDIPVMAAMLRELVGVMEERSERLAGNFKRNHEPTLQDPLIVCFIDEMGDLTTYEDKKVKEQIIGDMAKLLRRARAVGITLVMILQDPRKEAIPFRSLIPHGIGLRLKDLYEVDAILGPGAYQAGADCPGIPGKPEYGQSVDGRGVAYVTQLGETTPLRVRASFVEDQDIAEMAAAYPAFKRLVVVDDEQEAA